MKRLGISIGFLGAAHATLWAWLPEIVRWQTRNVLERFNAAESFDVAMQAFYDNMKDTFIQSGISGFLMLLASILILLRYRAGWYLWIVCLGVFLCVAIITVTMNGVSFGAVIRLMYLGGFAYASLRAFRSGSWNMERSS